MADIFGDNDPNTLNGTIFDDNIRGDSDSDILNGDSGNDLLYGENDDDLLNGDSGDDQLFGDRGNDWLYGGNGRDILDGGSGADIFEFNARSEMGLEREDRDLITDFTPGLDRIDLYSLDADITTPGDDAFAGLIDGTQPFSAPAQLRLTGGVLYGNLDADSEADFAIELDGVFSLAVTDLIL